MRQDPMVLSVFLLDGECRIAPLKIEEETISDPEWRYFRSVIEDIRVMGESHKLAFKEHDSIPQETKKIILLLADPQLNLSNPATLQSLAGHYLLRWVSTNHPRLPAASAEKPALFYAPIITIGYEDIMSTYSLPRALEETDPEKRRMRDYDMDSRYKFLDSSIWHRYVPTHSGDDYVFRERFKAVLQEVIQHHEDELYRTNAARAMLEFQLRMMRESYIYPVGERNHSRMVTPFKFHSETQMREKAEQLMKDYFKANSLNKKLHWRFLLIDDYASTGISADNNDNIKWSKKGLIKKLLKGLKIAEIDHPKESEGNGGASTSSDLINKCLNLLEGPKRYDVLLLDYLLAGIPGKPEEREYGFEFLQLLETDSQSAIPKFKRGPFMRHWIFPISSFPFALYDKLRQLGIDNYHGLWHLSGGGDPITTPHLFRYNLLNFLKQQVLEAYLDDGNLANYLQVFSNIDQAEHWSTILEARLKHLLAQIQILDSYRTKHKEGNEKHSHFSEKLYHFIHYKSKYARVLKELLKIVELFNDVQNNPDSDVNYLSNILENPENLMGSRTGSILKSYPLALNAIWEKMKSFLFTTSEVKARILKDVNQHELNLSKRKGKRILIIPKEIKQVEQLEDLKLNDNLLQTLPDELTQLKELWKLEVRNNKLKAFPQVLFKLSERLEYLDLRGNHLPLGLNKRAMDKMEVKELFRQAAALEVQPIEEARKKIEENEIEGAFDTLSLLFKRAPNLKETFINQVTMCEHRFNAIQEEKINGILSDETYLPKKLEIINALLKILSLIEEKMKA